MPSVAQARSLTDPLLQFLWEILIPKVPGAVGNAAYNLSLRARQASIPGMSVEKTLTFFKGHPIQRLGRRMYPHTITFLLEEGLDLTVLNALVAWFNNYRNEETGKGSGESAAKVDGFVRLLNIQDTVIAKIHMHGFVVESLPDTTLTYAGGAPVDLSVVFGYDYWTLE